MHLQTKSMPILAAEGQLGGDMKEDPGNNNSSLRKGRFLEQFKEAGGSSVQEASQDAPLLLDPILLDDFHLISHLPILEKVV